MLFRVLLMVATCRVVAGNLKCTDEGKKHEDRGDTNNWRFIETLSRIYRCGNLQHVIKDYIGYTRLKRVGHLS